MYNKKNKRNKNAFSTKSVVLLTSLLVITLSVIGGSIAWLISRPAQVTNTFIAGKPDITIEETIKNKVKTDVKVTNTGNIPVFVRAVVTVNWKAEDGTIKPAKPGDYTMTGPESGWFELDGIWYHDTALAPKAQTSNLINSCKPAEGKAPEGYDLNVVISSQAIQADPADFVAERWPVAVTNGKLTAKSK